MKALLTFTLIILLYLDANSQVKEVFIPVTEMHNTYSCYQATKLIIEKHSQNDLIKSNYPFHFRAWFVDRAIEIWEDSLGKVNGLVFFWANESKSTENNQKQNTFSKTFPLDRDSVKVLKELVLSSILLNLPTDGAINGWQFGNDGVTYSFEYSTRTFYSFKKYWEPESQDSVKEAKQVLEFERNFSLTSNTNADAKIFYELVPFQRYTNGSFGIIIKDAFKRKSN